MDKYETMEKLGSGRNLPTKQPTMPGNAEPEPEPELSTVQYEMFFEKWVERAIFMGDPDARQNLSKFIVKQPNPSLKEEDNNEELPLMPPPEQEQQPTTPPEKTLPTAMKFELRETPYLESPEEVFYSMHYEKWNERSIRLLGRPLEMPPLFNELISFN
ncbi:OLC1v1004463C1 [Oldenlandia corymbosa var. corymbosa]|uniref:OLC1v1004463C1 n=1 Tax=Oldenlandia corymbosa var. corymbosa TaxID=529605 RepID=A0AAV1DDM3_OLDCO|nr:OLC1v1004463C1 [Oldenlandia corymbosa var. corymbosa]